MKLRQQYKMIINGEVTDDLLMQCKEDQNLTVLLAMMNSNDLLYNPFQIPNCIQAIINNKSELPNYLLFSSTCPDTNYDKTYYLDKITTYPPNFIELLSYRKIDDELILVFQQRRSNQRFVICHKYQERFQYNAVTDRFYSARYGKKLHEGEYIFYDHINSDKVFFGVVDVSVLLQLYLYKGYDNIEAPIDKLKMFEKLYESNSVGLLKKLICNYITCI